MNLVLEFQEETSYQKNVLKRIMAAVNKLTSCEFPFRGDDEKLSSVHNGNFHMLLEYLSEYDPF